MNISSNSAPLTSLVTPPKPEAPLARGTGNPTPESEDKLREAFRDFVGETLFGQMLSAMRSTVDKPAYLHGGQTEEIFRQQLDQIMVEDITESSASSIADPMYELFTSTRY